MDTCGLDHIPCTASGNWQGQSSKNPSFYSYFFLENSKNFVIFTNSSNKFGKFSSFLGFCKISIHFLVFSYVFF